jgi:hypothetical protein
MGWRQLGSVEEADREGFRVGRCSISQSGQSASQRKVVGETMAGHKVNTISSPAGSIVDVKTRKYKLRSRFAKTGDLSDIRTGAGTGKSGSETVS